MSRRALPSVSAIDIDLYHLLQMHGAKVVGIHQHTMHLKLDDQVITLGHHIGRSKHHIVCAAPIECIIEDFEIGQEAWIQDKKLWIGSQVFMIPERALSAYFPYVPDQSWTVDAKVLDELEHMISNEHPHNVFHHEADDRVNAYVFSHILAFLNEPNATHAKSLLGLGMGLTPLGDDVLAGYILGKQVIKADISWLDEIIEMASQKTHPLSVQTYRDLMTRQYPDLWIDMIEGVLKEGNIEKTRPMLNLGATSGAGMLTGFIYGLRQEVVI